MTPPPQQQQHWITFPFIWTNPLISHGVLLALTLNKGRLFICLVDVVWGSSCGVLYILEDLFHCFFSGHVEFFCPAGGTKSLSGMCCFLTGLYRIYLHI